MFLFTSESVSAGHPDKIADQIADAILDAHIVQDPNARVACEVLVTTGLVVLAGEFRSEARVDFEAVARKVIAEIGYTHSGLGFDAYSCGVISVYHKQSPDIAQGVDREGGLEQLGAGDQGMMFGYATVETPNRIPFSIDLSHRLMETLARLRQAGKFDYLRPDAKSQVTVAYEAPGQPRFIHTILLSVQHVEPEQLFQDSSDADERFRQMLREDLLNILLPEVESEYRTNGASWLADLLGEYIQEVRAGRRPLLVNPTGRFVIGGPHGDTGLTGRKTIVDTYGGWAPHGGGAFSGKDPSKVDRSAAYMLRYIARNLVGAGVAQAVTLQVAYAIGIPDPVSIHVDLREPAPGITPARVEEAIRTVFDLRPGKIIKTLRLDQPIYLPTAAYGHMGREAKRIVRKVYTGIREIPCEVELFPWEKEDRVPELRQILNL